MHQGLNKRRQPPPANCSTAKICPGVGARVSPSVSLSPGHAAETSSGTSSLPLQVILSSVRTEGLKIQTEEISLQPRLQTRSIFNFTACCGL
eukprot:5685509-Amphidinium_carterae.2